MTLMTTMIDTARDFMTKTRRKGTLDTRVSFSSLKRKKRPFPIVFLVPKAGLEPARCRHQRILSPSRLPIPPLRHVGKNLDFILTIS